MKSRATTAATLTAFLSILPAAAHAQRAAAPTATPTPDPSVVAARAAYDAGRQAFDAHDYETALSNFQHAYELRSNPVVLIPIANCQEQMHHVGDAVTTLERYLHDRADAPDRAQVEARVAGLRAMPSNVFVMSDPLGAAIEIDGQPVGRTTPSTLPLAPGHHTLRLSLAGHDSVTREIDATPGSRIDSSGRLAVTSATRTPAAPDEPPAIAETPVEPLAPQPVATGTRPVSPAVWTGVGVAGAALVTGTVFGFLALGTLDEYNKNPTAETRDHGQTQALVADICFAGAIAAGAVALIVYVADRRERRPAPVVTALHAPTPSVHIAPTGFALTF